MAVMKLCLKCTTLVEQGTKYCTKHTTQPIEDKRERNRHYDTFQRDKERTAFYNGRAWKVIRIKVMKRDKYLCKSCLSRHQIKRADLVDHIKPLEFFKELALDLDNLQCLCNRCHQAKTAEDKKRYAHLTPLKPQSQEVKGYRPNVTIIDEYEW